MRICLMIEGQEGVAWADWVALAEACERLGFDALFRSDHYLSVDGHGERGSLDAWGTVTALSALTTTLRLGTLVSPATFRHPSALAKAVVTADHVSGGRVELGIGTGWLEEEHTAYGFAFPPMGERMAVLSEQLEIIHRQWTEHTFDFHWEALPDRGPRRAPEADPAPAPAADHGRGRGPTIARASPRGGPTSTTRSTSRPTRPASAAARSTGRARRRAVTPAPCASR